MEKYTKNQNIYSCLSGEHMCVLECIYVAIYKEAYKKLKGIKKHNFKIKEVLQRII
jgi:hypothetical protein